MCFTPGTTFAEADSGPRWGSTGNQTNQAKDFGSSDVLAVLYPRKIPQCPGNLCDNNRGRRMQKRCPAHQPARLERPHASAFRMLDSARLTLYPSSRLLPQPSGAETTAANLTRPGHIGHSTCTVISDVDIASHIVAGGLSRRFWAGMPSCASSNASR